MILFVFYSTSNLGFSIPLKSIDKDNEWTIFLVDNSGNVGRGSSLAIDSYGYPHICYFNKNNLGLKYAHWSGSNWIIETVDSPVTNHLSLVIDSNNIPHIGYMYYYNYPNKMVLKYAVRNGSQWEKKIIDSDRIAGWGVQLSLDLNDIPHMSYAVNDNPINYHKSEGGDIKHAWLEDGSWVTETVETFCWNENSISITSDNEVCIAFDKLYEVKTKSTDAFLKIARKSDSTWNITSVDSWSKRNGAVSLAADPYDETLHISYCEEIERPMESFSGEDPVIYDYVLRYARFVNNNWELYIVDDTKGKNGYRNSLALDLDGNPHISYTFYNTTEDILSEVEYQLRYASFIDVESDPYWMTSVVGEGGDEYGWYNSLQFDYENNPHIGYYRNSMFGGLMVATKADFTHAPDVPSIPNGPAYGYVDILYNYSTFTSDPDNDAIFYGWDWDRDNIEDEWTGAYVSGDTCTVSHIWHDPGTYEVKVMARDIYGAISDWSDKLIVIITKHKAVDNDLMFSESIGRYSLFAQQLSFL